MILLILNFKFKYYSVFLVLPLGKHLLAYQWRWLPLILKNHLIYGFPSALTAFKGVSTETTVTHTHLTDLDQVLYIFWLHQKISPAVSILGPEDIILPDLEVLMYLLYCYTSRSWEVLEDLSTLLWVPVLRSWTRTSTAEVPLPWFYS